jgi:M6 family metalloprotease-like protein
MKRNIFFVLLFIFLSLMTYARPVRTGICTYIQPDGTSFLAKCTGDEFYKIHTTADGHAIIKGKDGWWYYALFEDDGARRASGHKVGHKAPAAVLDNSRNIPYAQIREAAFRKREIHSDKSIRPNMMSEGRTTKRALIILAQFKDVSFQYGRDQFVDMLTQKGYSHNGATGSAKEYFEEQFRGKKEFVFEVSEVVTLSGRRAYYGANDEHEQDSRPAEMIKEACELADALGTDFSAFDEDGDTYVDNVFVFFAGGDEAEHTDQTDFIWSHSWYVKSGAGISLTLDGKQIDRYACTSELAFDGRNDNMTGIGTFCHEFSHTMDLPDLYDTDYETNGWGAGMWTWTSLMDGGNMNNENNTPPHYNAIEREILGIATPTMITRNGTYTLEPINASNMFYRLNTGNPGEYYLIECREAAGWDTYINGSGMLIYRIDKSEGFSKRWKENTVNAYAGHQCADLIEADKRDDEFLSANDYVNKVSSIKGIFFPNQSSTTVHLTSDISMTNIKKEGDRISFSIVGFAEDVTPPAVANIGVEAFMDAAIIQFESGYPFGGEAVVTWGRTGQIPTETIVEPYDEGKYSLTLTGLTPGNKTYTVNIHFRYGDIAGESASVPFMTTKASPVEWPYIYVGKNRADEDGTFKAGTKIALMAYNASDAEEVRWFFNDRRIEPEGDGYYTLTESGILKADIFWKDGSEDRIEKKVKVVNEY